LVFKTWQIFIFSLIPLALVFIGVISGSFHGSDSDAEVFPTAAPIPTSAALPPTGGPPPPGSVALQLVAANLEFDRRTLSAPPNTQVTLRLVNNDGGVLHNFALYNNNRAQQKIFAGDLVTGPAVKDYVFTTPAPGTYYFRCDSHPDQMNGTFTVR
jgi:plastocyanin